MSFRMSKLDETVINGGKYSNAFKVHFILVQEILALFSQKNHFHSGLFCIKLWQRRDGCSPSPVAPHEDDPGSLTSSAVPILTTWNLRTEAAGIEPAEGICAVYHWVFLRQAFPHLSASRKTLGWAAALVRKVRDIPDQPSGDNPSVVFPCQWDAGVLARESAHSGSVPQWQCRSASDGQGPPARPRSPPLRHTRPLCSTDANGLGSFLSYKPSHCPWEVLSFVFLFQLELATHHSLPRHNAALCGCLQHALGNAVMGTGPGHERKGLC